MRRVGSYIRRVWRWALSERCVHRAEEEKGAQLVGESKQTRPARSAVSTAAEIISAAATAAGGAAGAVLFSVNRQGGI